VHPSRPLRALLGGEPALYVCLRTSGARGPEEGFLGSSRLLGTDLRRSRPAKEGLNTQRLASTYYDLTHGWHDIQRLARERWFEYGQGQDADPGGRGKSNADKIAVRGRMVTQFSL